MRATSSFVCNVTLSIVYFISMAQASRFEPEVTVEDRRAHIEASALQPNWISERGTFWFRRSNSPKNSTFVYVDPHKAVQKPVFDHVKVAKALKEQGIEASASNLPFTWIDLKDGSQEIRFRAGEKSWEWRENETLAPFEGSISGEGDKKFLTPLSHEQPPTEGTEETGIKFRNEMKVKISMFWVNSKGKEKRYQDVAPGRTAFQHTYVGHVWRAKQSTSGLVVASFAAESTEKTAVIKEGLQPAVAAASKVDTLSRRQTNGTNGDNVFLKS